MSKIKAVEVNGKTWTKDNLKELLVVNDKAVIKGMLTIYDYQTSHEQASENTVEANGVGFSGVDGFIMSKFSEWYKLKGYLSPKQLAMARKKMLKYTGQLLLIMAGVQEKTH